MSFNVKGYLQDIDREIVAHRQEIAKRRLRISELEDTRVLMMQREEYRAEMNGEVSPFGVLPPGVEIAVRQQQRMLSDEGLLSHAAKTGELPPPTEQQRREVRAQKQRDYRAAREQTPERKAYKAEYNRRKAEAKAAANGKPVRARTGMHRKYFDQIERLLRTNPKSVFSVDAIVDRMGEGPLHGHDRQPVYQALYELNRRGIAHKPHTGAYQISPKVVEPQEPPA